MLVVRVELWPGGNYRTARTIASMVIGNQSQLAEESDYHIRRHTDGSTLLGVAEEEVEFEIKQHKRSQSVWALVAKAAGYMPR